MIHVCWHEGTDSFAHSYGRSGYSCCTLLNQMFDQYECAHWSTFPNLPPTAGAVVIIQGGNEKTRVAEINRDLATLGWAIVVIIGDEGCDFPLGQLVLPERSLLWFQMPQPGYTKADRNFIVGFSRDVPRCLDRSQPRTLDWFFAGQDTHIRRHLCLDELAKLTGGMLVRTAGFMQGISHDNYFGLMAQAKVIPCPSGPASPDTLRFAEALEFGCVPIIDRYTPRYDRGDYWQTVFQGPLPFPIVDDWATLPQVMADTLANWDRLTLECQQWWASYKEVFNSWLGEDIQWLTK